MDDLGIIALFSEYPPCQACGAKFSLDIKDSKTICTKCGMENNKG